MLRVDRDSGSYEALRSSKRLKLFESASLMQDGEVRRIHLLDISATGALAHAEQAPSVGATVCLSCGDIAKWAEVRWSDGGRFGLNFLTPLLTAEVLRIAKSAQKRAA